MALRKNASVFVGLVMLSLVWKAAWAKVEVNMEDRVEVYLGNPAQITCMFTVPVNTDDVIIQWYKLTKTKNRLRLYYGDRDMETVDKPFQDKVSVMRSVNSGEVVLTIKDVVLEDEREYICQVNESSGTIGVGRTSLKVFVAPDRSLIEGVYTGISVESSLSKIGRCVTENGYPMPNITWYRDQTPLQKKPNEVDVKSVVTQHPNGLYRVESDLYLKVVKEDERSVFYCEVSYFTPGRTMMTETDKIKITVFYPTTSVNVRVGSPKGLVKEGDTVEVRCHADGKPEPPMTITHNGVTLEQNFLVLSDVTRQVSGIITCSALNTETFEEISGNAELFVHFLDPAVLSPKGSHVMKKGADLNVTCNALSSLNTHTEWFKKGKKVADGHMLVLKDAGFETTGTYVCEVTVPSLPGLRTNGSLHVIVQAAPEIQKSDDIIHLEKNTEEVVKLNCHVRGNPSPVITWSSSDQSLILKEESHKQTENGVLSVVSFTVSSDIMAYCNASNNLGNDSVSFRIKAIVPTTVTAPSTTATPVSTPAMNPTRINSPEKVKKEGSGVIIAVIIVCILLLAILGSVLYFLYKKGKIPCGRSGKQDLTKPGKDNIVVEMKSDNTEEAVLLGVNGDNKPPNDQGDKYMDVQK
ncbi:melanoma cell adhesion molecule b isoform X2 [Esox lucius]|uniref:melanoma cell adhesion molecule b isoform X2 n=1 Tax=Esox lucius TaxID=8010 RepID=UPI001476C8B6|nr:melanoma cell adhesion molecule b isoform X2 [Esox lucius]